MITVQAAAAQLGRPVSTINYWCRQNDIGTLVTSRLRLLTADELAKLREIAATIQPGNRGPRDAAGKFSAAHRQRRTQREMRKTQ